MDSTPNIENILKLADELDSGRHIQHFGSGSNQEQTAFCAAVVCSKTFNMPSIEFMGSHVPSSLVSVHPKCAWCIQKEDFHPLIRLNDSHRLSFSEIAGILRSWVSSLSPSEGSE